MDTHAPADCFNRFPICQPVQVLGGTVSFPALTQNHLEQQADGKRQPGKIFAQYLGKINQAVKKDLVSCLKRKNAGFWMDLTLVCSLLHVVDDVLSELVSANAGG
jgi:hypothetical protein